MTGAVPSRNVALTNNSPQARDCTWRAGIQSTESAIIDHVSADCAAFRRLPAQQVEYCIVSNFWRLYQRFYTPGQPSSVPRKEVFAVDDRTGHPRTVAMQNLPLDTSAQAKSLITRPARNSGRAREGLARRLFKVGALDF
jgi:hypothetical protein